MNKYIITILVLLLLVVFAGGVIYTKRRHLPFQEIIALDRGIAVVNAQHWYMDDLKVVCKKNGRELGKKQYNDQGFVVFPNLENDNQYTVEIYRTDLKGKILYKSLKRDIVPHKGGDKYYILVGASIGKEWNIGKLPERLNLDDHVVFGTRTVYQFDKTQTVKNILALPFPVSGVILKECSAYFPRDTRKSLKDLIAWDENLKKRGIKPILATTVPLTARRAGEVPEKQKSLEHFNDLIRQYGKQAKNPVLDLEVALRVSATKRYLKDDFAQKDGTHLVKKAYKEALDPIVLPVLNSSEGKSK